MRGLREALKSVRPDTTSLGGDSHNIDRAKLSGVLQELASSLIPGARLEGWAHRRHHRRAGPHRLALLQ
jgi:hypothetical protein